MNQTEIDLKKFLYLKGVLKFYMDIKNPETETVRNWNAGVIENLIHQQTEMIKKHPQFKNI